MELLAMLKRTLGVMDNDTSKDEYYKRMISMAKADLLSDDISDKVLQKDIGQETVVYYASLLIKEQDIATNPTLTNLRNKLSSMTKGEKYADRKTSNSNI